MGKSSPILLAGGFPPGKAIMAVEIDHEDENVAIGFGGWVISNPEVQIAVCYEGRV